MQFISSADSVKSILLEQVLKTGDVSGVLKSVEEAGVETGSLGTLDPSFLTPIINILDALENFDLDDCDIDISTILGFDAAVAFDVSEDVIGVLNDTLKDPNFTNAIGSLSSKLANIGTEADADSGQPIYPSYRFNQEFYNDFVNYIDLDELSYNADNSSLLVPAYFTSSRTLGAGGWPSESVPIELYFNFPHIYNLEDSNYLKIVYPIEIWNQPNMKIEFVSSDEYIPFGNLIVNIADSEAAQNYDVDTVNQQNVYVKAFVDKLGLPPSEISMAEGRLFPAAYASLVDNMFDYVVENGVFDAATLQSLNFFHLNENCPPSEVADLLDVDGILQQMRTEYLESACNDENIPQRTKIRNMIKFGMYLLLIQIQIAEFIIKNIFVFSAFKIDDLFENNFIKSFMRQQATSSIISYLTAQGVADTTVRQDLVSYFNLKINRRSVVTQGGIKFSNGDIAFPTGTQFSIVDNGAFAGFDEIVDYLISERLVIGATAVNNAIKKAIPGNNPVSLDDALFYSLDTFEVLDDSENTILLGVENSSTFEELDYLVFMTVKTTETEPEFNGFYEVTKSYKLWFYWKGSINLALLGDFGSRTFQRWAPVPSTALSLAPDELPSSEQEAPVEADDQTLDFDPAADTREAIESSQKVNTFLYNVGEQLGFEVEQELRGGLDSGGSLAEFEEILSNAGASSDRGLGPFDPRALLAGIGGAHDQAGLVNLSQTLQIVFGNMDVSQEPPEYE
jgi:hypothetical protein